MSSIAKRAAAWVLAAVMIISLLPLSSMAAEPEKEVIISSGEELAGLAAAVNGGNSYEGWEIVLGQSLDMSGIEFTAIGTPEHAFKGSFDGNGNTISNLTLKTGEIRQGLFGYINGGKVKNVRLENITIPGNATWVGGIAGYTNGTIENCSVSGTISGRVAVAGIVGDLFGKVTNCENTATITARENNAGGIAGYMGDGGTITSSINKGKITGAFNVAGIVGEQAAGEVSGCANQETITGSGNDTGGITGLQNGGTIRISYNTGNVCGGTGTCGGIVGYVNGGHVTNVYNRADVTAGAANTGGVAGAVNSGSTVTCGYSAGNVKNESGYVGGSIGWNLAEGTVRSCYHDSVLFNGSAIGKNEGSGEAIGKTTEGLKTETAYEGFNFESVWRISEDDNDGYPIFQTEKSSSEKVTGDLEWLTFERIQGANENAGNITANLELPVEGAYGSSIFWSTSRPEVILNSGVVTPDEKQAMAVTLTARITAEGVSETKSFDLVVQPGTADEKPLHILQIGDSNTEFARITQGMNQILKREYGNYSEGFLTLCKDYLKRDDVPIENFSISYDGNWRQYDLVYGEGELKAAQDAPFGLYVQSRVPGEKITVKFVGSAVDLYYLTWSGAGSFQVTIDGTDKGTVVQTSDEFVTKKAVYEGLEYGLHTMELKNVSGTINFYGADYRVDGASIRKNISTWGKAGIQAKEYATVLNEDVFNSAIKELNPDIVTILLGTNDNGWSECPADELKGYLTTIINRVKENMPDAEIWVVSTFETYNSVERLHSYWDTTFPNAAKEAGVHYWSMGEWFGSYTASQMADGWHSNWNFSKKIAEKMYEVILGGTDVVGRNIISTEANKDVKAGTGTALADLKLPEKVLVTLDDLQNTKVYADVIWSSESYEAEKAGRYTLTGEIKDNETKRIYNPEKLTASICVELEEGYEAKNGLKLHYDFSKMDGAAVQDLAGNYDGELCGAAAVTEGMQGKAVSLPGNSDSYISIPAEVFKDMDGITISVWVKLDEIRLWTTLLGVGSSQQNYFVLAAKGTPGGTACGVTAAVKEEAGTEYRVKASAEQEIPVGQWCQVTYTQQYDIACLYLDGVLTARQEGMKTTLQDIVRASSSTAHLGAAQVWPDPAVKGLIDEIKIYDRALSAEEVKAEAEQKDADIKGEEEVSLVIDKINSIGEVEVTAESKAKIDEARRAYDALTAAQKAKVTNAEVLFAAETAYGEKLLEVMEDARKKAEAAAEKAEEAAERAAEAEKNLEEAQKELEAAQKAVETAQGDIEDLEATVKAAQEKADEAAKEAETANQRAQAAEAAAEAAKKEAEAAQAKAAAEANRVLLSMALNVYKDLDTGAYTEASVSRLTEALSAGQSVYDDEASADEAVINATENILKAAAALTVDTTKTEQEIQAAKDAAEAARKELEAQQEELAKLMEQAEEARRLAEDAKASQTAQGTTQQPDASVQQPDQQSTVAEGQICPSGNYYYRILSNTDLTVEVTGLKNKDLTKISVYNSVTFGGKKYRVVGIADGAFKNNKKVTSVTIAKNVETIGSEAFAGCTKLKKVMGKSTVLKEIGKKAFSGCKKLKRITLKSKKLKKVGANAFKGINKKAVIKVPAAKYKAYAKLLAKKGQSKTVTIKK